METHRKIGASVIGLLLLGALAWGCSGGGGCKTSCSGHGHCETGADGEQTCVCDSGYEPSPDGQECLPGDACSGVDCSLHGACVVGVGGTPACVCNTGYEPSPDGLDCVEAGTCSTGADCVNPPAATCAGDTLNGYQVPGTCNAGQCAYTPAPSSCGGKGCCANRCCVLIPSNQADLGDLQPNSLSRAASGSFDTDSGCQAGSSLGDCTLVEPARSVKVCVCRVGTLTISNLRVTGEAALAVLAWGSISVDGTLDLSASGDASGAGAVESSKGDATGMLGGSGGSNGTVGGNLGDAASPASVIPLRGGQAGQFGCNDRVGGGAGGGVQLSAGDSVTVGGSIVANGGGGQGGNGESLGSCLGGAGGGSGGSILIEAPTVTITGSIYANGGAGGGGGNSAGETGGSGADASCSVTPAVGGTGQDGHGCALYGNTEGGEGGAGAVGSSNGGDGESYDELQCPDTFDKVGGGGGGGAMGRLRVNTRTTCSCTGTFSPPVSSGHAQGT